MTTLRVFTRLAWVLTLLTACGPDTLAISSEQSQTITLQVDQELDLTVGTPGPGEYMSPPSISSSAVRFLDVSYVGTSPAGPAQLFRFRGDAMGQAIVVIQHSHWQDRTISDTVNVR